MVSAMDINSKEDYFKIVRRYEKLFGWEPAESITKDYVKGMLPILQDSINEPRDPMVIHDEIAGYLALVYDLKKLDIGVDYYCDGAE